MKRKHIIIPTLSVLLSVGFFLTLSCAPMSEPLADWTLLVYMIADNNLDSFTTADINEMESALPTSNVQVVVYVDRAVGSVPEAPVCLRIVGDRSKEIVSELVRTYIEQDSCDDKVLAEFIGWAKSTYPARRYGLVLWSHGTGWIPAKRSFGEDASAGQSEMEISDLATALPDHGFAFITFDACLMGDVETAYALRNKAKYLIASQTEVQNDGFPYRRVVLRLTGRSNRETVQGIAEDYFNYYATNEFSALRSASVAVVDLSAMDATARSVCRMRLSEWKRLNGLMHGGFPTPIFASIWGVSSLS